MRGVLKNGVFTKTEKESGKLRMSGGSWSINLQDLDITRTDKIVYETESATYTISTTDALKYGWQMRLGGELKLVIPIKHWERKPHNGK